MKPLPAVIGAEFWIEAFGRLRIRSNRWPFSRSRARLFELAGFGRLELAAFFSFPAKLGARRRFRRLRVELAGNDSVIATAIEYGARIRR